MRGGGLRRITFFPDRPDVLSTFTVRMEGPKALFRCCCRNGNKVSCGDEHAAAEPWHWAEWHDPWPKPSYLFALVAGDLVARADRFTTMGGRKVDLASGSGRTICAHRPRDGIAQEVDAMGRTDVRPRVRSRPVQHRRGGRFQLGAMENKGLNVFNTKYCWPTPRPPTDGDYDGSRGVIAHEYFHNGRATG